MKNQDGFTLVEMMVAVVIAGIVMGSIMYTFTSQQKSFMVQEQVAMMQQNLRASMYYITSEVQMAGYRISSDINTYSMDWDPTSGGNEVISPLIYGRNNDNDGGGNDVRDGTDLIMFVKASEDEWRTLGSGEGNSGTASLSLSDLDFNGDGDNDLTDATGNRPYAILVKSDLSRAEFIKVKSISSGATQQQVTIEPGFELTETYSGVSDIIARADIIIYRINEDGVPALERRNLGRDNGSQVLGEGISDMQIQYILKDGSSISGVSTVDQAKVREVDITLTGQANIPGAGLKQRSLRSCIKVRNFGTSM